MTLGQRLSQTASEHPNRTALIFEGKRYSYRTLDSLASHFAAGLGSLGIGRGDRVAILFPNCPEFVVSYFGIVKTGAAVVPLNTFLAAPELAYILQNSGAKALVGSSSFLDKIAAVKGASEALQHVVIAGGDMPGALSFEALASSKGTCEDASGEDEPAAMLYTSGTTGRPKGAVLTHRNLLSNAAACAERFSVTRRDRFLLFLPMFHAFSFLVCLLLPLSVGASVIVLPSVRPFSRVVKAVVFGRATFFVAIPPVYNLLSQRSFPKFLIRLLPLRLLVSGAAPLSPDTIKRFAEGFPVPLLEGYGLTEASPVVSCNPIDGARKPGSVGLPLPGVQVGIFNEAGGVLPPGEVGEIAVKGENVMKGYLDDDEATADAIRDGWLHTGDLGYMDGDGYIFIVDRKKDLIISHGMNIYPREVEEALTRHPAVREAAVVGVRDDLHGEIPKAFISLKDGASLTEREVKEFLRARLAAYKVPRQVEFLPSLPLSPTGKVLKRQLRPPP